jgi:cytidylate kinase
MIVAIDGPAGAGKSSVARGVAEKLGAAYLDSGAMYRCVALASIEDPSHTPAELAGAVHITLSHAGASRRGGRAGAARVRLDGRDVTAAIRRPDVSARASEVAADPAVRAALVARQRELLARGDWVAEGRDIGTVVAPHADLQNFLTASPEERARRRSEEPGTALSDRDKRDSERAHSPLKPAADARVVDTTSLTLAQVVAQIVRLARTKLASDLRGAH